jgi:trafficking protein particle complex subunit 5
MIGDPDLLFNRFISVPKDMAHFNPGFFVAGIVHGVLDSAGFPCRVSSHFVQIEGQPKPRTTILMKFEPAVLQREQQLDEMKGK